MTFADPLQRLGAVLEPGAVTVSRGLPSAMLRAGRGRVVLRLVLCFCPNLTVTTGNGSQLVDSDVSRSEDDSDACWGRVLGRPGAQGRYAFTSCI